MADPSHIVVRGAAEHNLKHVDVEIPRDALVVFTGVSGSGKSSLAFDTIYQEGQRRFVESLSAYARQFLGQMERPRVEAVEGISPTLSIDQKTVNRNPRSTVGTVTEIYDHLRLLMARLGTPRCPVCHTAVSKLTVDDIADEVLQRAAGKRVLVLGPVVRERKGEYRKELGELARDGWLRARIDGEVRRLDEEIALARYEKHTIEVVVDRLSPDSSERDRLVEALETGLRLGTGVCVVNVEESGDLVFAAERACPNHPDVSIPELEPRLFSFNAPQGACPACEGLGAIERFDAKALVDHEVPAIDSYRAFTESGNLPFGHFDKDALREAIKAIGGDPKKPLSKWPADQRERLLRGDPEVVLTVAKTRDDGRVDERSRPWLGLVGLAERVWKWTGGWSTLARFRASTPCPDCGGKRLNAIARAVDFHGKGIVELAAMTVGQSYAFFGDLTLEGSEREVGELVVAQIRERLQFLHEVGLSYLALDRSAATLSGGEAQRIRLAAQVGSALQGVTYVLDEPSIGLHPRDNARLLATLRKLRDRGNTVLVVEHDAETIESADWVVDVGPGAGREGGHVTASTTAGRFRNTANLTARYLRGELAIPVPSKRRKGTGKALKVKGARAHNLHGIDAKFPLGTFTVVTGVSGSGKSTLIFQVLEEALEAHVNRRPSKAPCDRVDGLDAIDKVIRISQQPIGRTPRSNPATYTGAFDLIRDLFAQTPEAQARGYKKGRFSFNVAGGRCEACEGAGVKTVEMQFLPSVEVPCDACGARRFNRETLEITWKGRSIADVLAMTVAEALEAFQPVPKLRRMLQTLVDVGLDYVPLGQPSTTVSGGEAQRMKLASELHRPATGRTVYLLDEPTTGLHFHDVAKLLHALDRLVEGGNTVIVIEHHHDVIKCADHVIDLGPEGGEAGGQIVGTGTPEQIARLDTPTGRALAAMPDLGGIMAHEPARAWSPRRRANGPRELVIEGARKHNLHGVDVRIPHGSLTVITGPSGSGKTSLAFDTIFSEGQRQYVESLSTYARRFLGRMDRAPVDHVEGLAPAIAIDQRNASHNPRSTVATVTEIHDVLRILYARIGVPHCVRCGREVRGFDPSGGARELERVDPGPGWLVARLRPVEHPAERRAGLKKDGWTRVLDEAGAEVDLDDKASEVLLGEGARLVVDRVDPKKASRSRLAEGVHNAYALGAGAAEFVPRRGGDAVVLTERPTCPVHGEVLPEELTPRHFSFNSRLGACPRCEGLGVARAIDPERLFPDRAAGFWDAMDPRVRSVMVRSPRNRVLIDALLKSLGLNEATPAAKWTAEQWSVLLEGGPGTFELTWTQEWGSTKRTVVEERSWPGLFRILQGWSDPLEWLVVETRCPRCQGGRLRPELLAVRIGHHGIQDLVGLSVDDASAALAGWSFEGERKAIAERPLTELGKRLRFLRDVGLGYLELDRPAETLSGGEAQRIRLASQLGGGLTGVIYVLDEPTIGLHPRDTDRLLGTLEGLRDQGNTVVVVEHDPDSITRADHVVDLGPGAGRHGGRVMATGTPQELIENPQSITGRWLSGRERIPPREARRAPRAWITVERPTGHHLKGEDARFPTGVWAAVSGVSGSGKSTLVMDTLAPALLKLVGQEAAPLPHSRLVAGETVDRVVIVDQQPIGRTPRSTPATYTGVLDPLRRLFAETPGAKVRGWTAGRFSFNAAGGRCALCEGRGAILVEMHFLPDVWIPCDACKGKRYDRETLSVRWMGHSIADVLGMRVDEALDLFARQRSIHRPLQALADVGLGYLTLGQPATTLSGGEAQRVKLAAELTSRKGHCVYVLDEPTTGLHLSDVARLVEVLHRLVDQGHTVVTIEHHLDILAQADWVLDLGPEGGAAGGHLIAAGTPEQVAAGSTPTGVALARALSARRAASASA